MVRGRSGFVFFLMLRESNLSDIHNVYDLLSDLLIWNFEDEVRIVLSGSG